MNTATKVCRPGRGRWRSVHTKFLKMLPTIRRQACLAFGHLPRTQREEQIAEVIANAYCALARLAQRGKLHDAFATPLATYAIRHVRAGRQVGTKLNVRDITSRYCQRCKPVAVESLDEFDRHECDWRDIAVEDRHAGPDHVVMVRIDFADWLGRLPARNRRIAEALARSERALDVARRFRLTPSRISQIRQELARSWAAFQGEEVLA